MSEADAPPVADGDLERYVARWGALPIGKGTPPDAALDRFKRDRFVVIGRPDETGRGDKGGAGDDVNVMYLRCESGKGFCSHAHANWEVFIPLSGRWEVEVEGFDKVELGPWDAMDVPSGIYHSARNISDGDAVLLGLNPGKRQPGFSLHPDVLAELSDGVKT